MTQGNPELNPFRSMNYDVSIDWYSDMLGVLGVAGFYKHIDGFIVDIEREIVDGPYQGFILSTVENSERGTLAGVELAYSLAYSKKLQELPAPLDGLAVDMNASFVTSQVDLPERAGETIPLDGQAALSGNIAISYYKGPIFAQATYGFIRPFLSAVVAPGEDVFEDTNSRLGGKLIYETTPYVSLSLSAMNLTNQHLLRYRGSIDRLRENEQSSWWAEIGVTARF